MEVVYKKVFKHALLFCEMTFLNMLECYIDIVWEVLVFLD